MFLHVEPEDIKHLLKTYFKKEYENHIVLTYLSNLICSRSSEKNILKVLFGSEPTFKPGDKINIKVGQSIGSKRASELKVDIESSVNQGLMTINSIPFVITEIAVGHYDYVYKGYVTYIKEVSTIKASEDSVNHVHEIEELYVTADDIYDYTNAVLNNNINTHRLADRF